MRTFDLLVAAFALVQALRYGRRALTFLLPGLRVTAEAGAGPRSPRRLRAGAELQALGFAPLGVMRARGVLGASAQEVDAYASPARGAYADVAERRGDAADVTFFTPFADGAQVLTANHRRPGVVREGLQAGGVPDAALEAVLAAHEVAVRRFAAAHGPPAVVADLDARLAAARAWEAGQGRRELRRRAALAFGIVLVAFALIASSLQRLLLR